MRTYDPVLRSLRREHLLGMAVAAADVLGPLSRYDVLVSGSLSRGQIHPWSDLDLVLELKKGRRRSVRDNAIPDAVHQVVGYDDIDIVFAHEVFPEMVRGLLGSLVPPDGIPDLSPLPDPSLAIARTSVSIRYAVENSRRVLENLSQYPDASKARFGNFELIAYGGAMRPLYHKAPLWLKKMAVFLDDGRSAWLDDHGDIGALETLLERLSDSQVIDTGAAATLRYLLVEAYGFMYHEQVKVSYKDDFISVVDAVEEMGLALSRLAPLVETHGLSASS